MILPMFLMLSMLFELIRRLILSLVAQPRPYLSVTEPSIAADQCTQKAREWLNANKISSANGPDGDKFISTKRLDQYFSFSRINDILDALFCDQESNKELAERILKGFLRQFCVLLDLEQPSAIKALVAQEHPLHPPSFPVHNNDHRLPNCVDLDAFKRAQRAYSAVKFSKSMKEDVDSDKVLPIIQKQLLMRGDGSVINMVEIHEDYDGLVAQSKTINPHTYVFKTYDGASRQLFDQEWKAYLKIHGQGKRIPSLLRYYGQFEYKGEYTIMLEYAKYGSLLDFMKLKKDRPPRRQADVEHFWRGILDLAQALDRTHRAEILHQDITPNNILICQEPGKGEYEVVPKLADYGRSKFGHRDTHNREEMTAQDNYGTKEYGAPEAHRPITYLKLTKLQIRQTADLWALAAVFLTVAIWMNEGWAGVERFRKARLRELEKLHGDTNRELVACFHNGTRPLETVRDELQSLAVRRGNFVEDLNARVCRDIMEPMLDSQSLVLDTAEKVTVAVDDMFARFVRATSATLVDSAGEHRIRVVSGQTEAEAPVPEFATPIDSESSKYFLDSQHLDKTILSKHVAAIKKPYTRVQSTTCEGRPGYLVTGKLLDAKTLEKLTQRSKDRRLQMTTGYSIN